MVHIPDDVTAFMNDGKSSGGICSTTNEKLPTCLWKFLKTLLRAIKLECLFVTRYLGHSETDDGSAYRPHTDRFGRPSRELQQPLARGLRHVGDLGGFLRFQTLVI